MLQLTVVRWKRFGHDRLYAHLPDGTAAGWADCTTGTITVLLQEYGDPVTSVLAPHLPGTPKSPATGAPWHAVAPSHAGAPSREGATSRRAAPDMRRRQGGLRSAPAPDATPTAAQTPHPTTPHPTTPDPVTPLLPPLTPPDDLAENAPGTALRPSFDESSAGPVARALARILGHPADGDPWRKGAGGERRVGAELDRLRRHGWHVLHSIPLPGDVDLDHLLIGPGGVFSINTKNHPGKPVWVGDDAVKVDNGDPRPYARRSRSEAERVQRVLGHFCGFGVPVEPVLVFVGVTDLKVEATQHRVRVYREREVSALAPLTGVWTPSQVTRIHSVARHRRAWLEA
ncbi:NERD domain-containing protein [Streptomyces sp. NPDC048643]|uniref:NERD domain-containing protein n=1 Tax=Streptomyces sp. NPDC048643 TaxID=3155637 RepID=UPI003437467F